MKKTIGQRISESRRARGMKQEELTSFYDGMKMELSRITADSIHIDENGARINARMDEYFAKKSEKKQ